MVVVEPEISQFPFEELLYMPRSVTSQDRVSACDSAPARVAFRSVDYVGILNFSAYFAAQYWAYTHLCQRFTLHLAIHGA